MSARPASHFVSISSQDLAAVPGVVGPLGEAIEEAVADTVRDHLGPVHFGLLAVLDDLEVLPVPEALRSSRDIRSIMHSLGDLETLGLVRRRGELVELPEAVREGLHRGLSRYWAGVGNEALERVAEAASAGARERRPRETVRRWLRNLAVMVANQGLRLNQAGELHAGDLRRWEKLAAQPTRRFLETTLRIGLSTGVLTALEDRLLVGESVDMLDMDEQTFAASVLMDVTSGRVELGLGQISGLMGLLEKWGDKLRSIKDAREDLPPLLGRVSPEPLSDFLRVPEAATLASAMASFVGSHQRVRLGLVGLIGHLPTGVRLPLEAVVALVHAHLSRDMLRHPCRPRLDGHAQPGLVAGAAQILPFAAKRVAEHLPAWIEEVWAPLGAAEVVRERDGAWLVVHDPQPDLLQALDAAWTVDLERVTPTPTALTSPGRILVQPNGDVLAPPDVTLHALVHVAQGADPSRLDDVVSFTITRRSLMRVLHSGLDVATWGEVVSELSHLPLPQTVVAMIEETRQRQGELVLAPASAVIVAREALRLDELLSHKRFASLVQLRPSPTVAIVAGDVDLGELLDAINGMGFGGLSVERIGS